MNLFRTISALGAVVLASASVASATTYTLGSYQSANGAVDPGFLNTATYSTPGFSSISNSYTLNPGTVWHAPLAANGVQSTWVGVNANDGPGGAVTNYEPNGTYDYASEFTVAYSSGLSGTLSVLADDTVSVYLNGNLVVAGSNTAYNSTCDNFAPTCTTVDTVVLQNSWFSATGVNYLSFVVTQSASYSTGLDYVGTVTSVTPEPSSLVLLGSGLFGSVGAMWRRRRS